MSVCVFFFLLLFFEAHINLRTSASASAIYHSHVLVHSSYTSICDSSLGHENCAEMERPYIRTFRHSKRCRSIHLIARAATTTPNSPRNSHPIHLCTPRTRFVQQFVQRIILCTRQAHTTKPKKMRETERRKKKCEKRNRKMYRKISRG